MRIFLAVQVAVDDESQSLLDDEIEDEDADLIEDILSTVGESWLSGAVSYHAARSGAGQWGTFFISMFLCKTVTGTVPVSVSLSFAVCVLIKICRYQCW